MPVGFTALAYNTSLGGTERSQQREIVIMLNRPVGLGAFEEEGAAHETGRQDTRRKLRHTSKI